MKLKPRKWPGGMLPGFTMKLDEKTLEEAQAEFERIVGAAVIEWWTLQTKTPDGDMNTKLQSTLRELKLKRYHDTRNLDDVAATAWLRLQHHRLYKQGWFDVVIAKM